MVLGNIANSIFGTPQKDAANEKQKSLVHDQLNRGNDLHNRGTTSVILRALGIRNYGKALSDAARLATKAQGAAFKTAESLARVQAAKGSVNEGGRSSRYKKNEDYMVLSQLNKAERLTELAKGEKSSIIATQALNKYHADMGKAVATAGVGISARRGITYTDDTAGNVMKLGKLAIAAATGTPPMDIFGTATPDAGGGNASFWQMITGQTV